MWQLEDFKFYGQLAWHVCWTEVPVAGSPIVVTAAQMPGLSLALWPCPDLCLQVTPQPQRLSQRSTSCWLSALSTSCLVQLSSLPCSFTSASHSHRHSHSLQNSACWWSFDFSKPFCNALLLILFCFAALLCHLSILLRGLALLESHLFAILFACDFSIC